MSKERFVILPTQGMVTISHSNDYKATESCISSIVIVVCVPFLFLSLSNLVDTTDQYHQLYDSLLSQINFSKMMMMTKRKAIEMEMGTEGARLLAKADEGGTAPIGALQLRGGSMEGRRIWC